jgi:citrate synthase
VSAPRSALARYQGSEEAWWHTDIDHIAANSITVRGERIEELIGTTSFSGMLALLVTGRRLTPSETALFDAALVAGADHGPLAPSIAAARMAATCGIGFNSVVATGINMLGDHHGGAVENFMRLLSQLVPSEDAAVEPAAVERHARDIVLDFRRRSVAVPGFGHQLHDHDPRRNRILSLLNAAVSDDVVRGAHLHAARALEDALAVNVRRRIPLNVDGVTGIVYSELSFPPDVAKGLFSLSRGAGIVAHALEELQRGGKIKGPCPPLPGLVEYRGAKRDEEPPSATPRP